MSNDYFIEVPKIKDKTFTPNILKNTWFMDSPIDEEHKHWKLLAYLKRLDENLERGFFFAEYFELDKRFKDMEHFIENFELKYKDSESSSKIQEIFDVFPVDAPELFELDKILENSYTRMRQKLFKLKSVITFISQNISIVDRQIVDRRKKLNIYIEQCNSSIIEHYVVSKKGVVEYKKSFFWENKIKDPSNFLFVKVGTSLNSIGTIIPFVIKYKLNTKSYLLDFEK